MALDFALANLQPVNGEFLGRQGRKEQHQGGDLAKAMKLKAEKSVKGKKVYAIDTTWYAKFKDLGFTTRSGKKIEGSHFLKYALTQHYDEIRDAMFEELSKGIDKVVKSRQINGGRSLLCWVCKFPKHDTSTVPQKRLLPIK